VHLASGIPCALLLEARDGILQNPGESTPRERGSMPRHCERKRSNPESLLARDWAPFGLLYLNDGVTRFVRDVVAAAHEAHVAGD
jgi:hypothetical protein